MRAPLCLFARGDNRDLLWALVTPPPQAPDQADTVWTLRAVHAPKGRGLTPEQQVQLKQYFSQPGKTYYHTIGRYLLGLADEAAVVGLAKDPKTSCEVAYYLGRRALDENRPRDASDWYRLAIETGQPRVLEHRWAYDEVQAWKAKGVSLGRLASAGP